MSVFLTGGVVPKQYDENTIFLLHGDNIKDCSMYGRSITNEGVTVSSDQSKLSGKSLYFNGASHLLIDNYDFGANDFTIEWWEYLTASDAGARFCTAYTTTESGQSSYGGLLYGYTGSTVYAASSVGHMITWDLISEASYIYSYGTGVWTHRAVVRSGTKLLFFSNGIPHYGKDIGTNVIGFDSQYPFAIGDYRLGDHKHFNGYIDEFRISNIARWTETFTPPTVAYEG